MSNNNNNNNNKNKTSNVNGDVQINVYVRECDTDEDESAMVNGCNGDNGEMQNERHTGAGAKAAHVYTYYERDN